MFGEYLVTTAGPGDRSSSEPRLSFRGDAIFAITEGVVSNINPTFPTQTSGSLFLRFRDRATNSSIATPVTTTETSQATLHVRTPSNNEFLVTDTEIEMRNSIGALGFRFDITTGDLDVAGDELSDPMLNNDCLLYTSDAADE